MRVPARPDRPDGVDDVIRRQAIPTRDLRVARIASSQASAFIEQPRPGGPVDGAVHPATTQQRPVRRVDDRVHRELSDVADNHDHLPRRSHSHSSRQAAASAAHPPGLGVSVTTARLK